MTEILIFYVVGSVLVFFIGLYKTTYKFRLVTVADVVFNLFMCLFSWASFIPLMFIVLGDTKISQKVIYKRKSSHD